MVVMGACRPGDGSGAAVVDLTDAGNTECEGGATPMDTTGDVVLNDDRRGNDGVAGAGGVDGVGCTQRASIRPRPLGGKAVAEEEEGWGGEENTMYRGVRGGTEIANTHGVCADERCCGSAIAIGPMLRFLLPRQAFRVFWLWL